MRSSSPKAMASFPIWSTAPSPRSSPKATPILSAASTNSSMLWVLVMPSLPAAPARAFSSSRLVRVSIRLKSSFMRRTSSSVCPVYFLVLAMASSISAKSCTVLRMVSDMPVSDATMPTARAWKRLAASAILPKKPPLMELSAVIRLSCALSCLAWAVICLNSAVPADKPRSRSFTIFSEYSSSLMLAPPSCLIVLSTRAVSRRVMASDLLACSISCS